VNRVLFALVALFVAGSALGQSPEPNKFRITTWNLEWFPNGSAREATQEKQAQRIKAAADVLKELNPDILLLQEVRDYDACNRLADAIQPGTYTVAICSAFKGGKQEEAILAKVPAQAAWSESWNSMEGIDPPRGFAFAWFKIGNANIGIYSVHLKSNLVTHLIYGDFSLSDILCRFCYRIAGVSALDSQGRTIWIADAHRDDRKRFVVRADES
jgi:exonuclease III